MKRALPLIALIGLTACLNQGPEASSSSSVVSVAGSEMSMTQRARQVANRFGASSMAFDAATDRGRRLAERNDPATSQLCASVEADTSSAAGLAAVTRDAQFDVYICAGFLDG